MLHNIQLYGWIAVHFIGLLGIGSWVVSNLFYYKQWSNEKPPTYIYHFYAFRCTCRKKLQSQIARPKGTCICNQDRYCQTGLWGCAILYSHKKYSDNFPLSGQQYMMVTLWNFCQSDEVRIAPSVYFKITFLLLCLESADICFCLKTIFISCSGNYICSCHWPIFLWICQSFSYSFVAALYIERLALCLLNVFYDCHLSFEFACYASHQVNF